MRLSGLAYFFNINVMTEFKSLFSDKPEININYKEKKNNLAEKHFLSAL